MGYQNETDEYTGIDRYDAVYTITLGELVESGVFDWSKPELDWSSAAYDAEQYERVCSYFIARFRYREVSMIPVGMWFDTLHYKIVYEIMPAMMGIYKSAADINAFAESDEYYKERAIDSEFPQTLMSGNSDYASNGVDREYERLTIGNAAEATARAMAFKAADEIMLDKLESMFVCMYTTNVSAL